MNLKDLFWSGGGMVLVLLSLIEVSPIKINPWSRLAKIIGHALNAISIHALREEGDPEAAHAFAISL